MGHSQLYVSDDYDVSVVEFSRLVIGKGLAVQVRTVGTADILEVRSLIVEGDHGVEFGHLRICDNHPVLPTPTDTDRFPIEELASAVCFEPRGRTKNYPRGLGDHQFPALAGHHRILREEVLLFHTASVSGDGRGFN